jgi:hypothetical protein
MQIEDANSGGSRGADRFGPRKRDRKQGHLRRDAQSLNPTEGPITRENRTERYRAPDSRTGVRKGASNADHLPGDWQLPSDLREPSKTLDAPPVRQPAPSSVGNGSAQLGDAPAKYTYPGRYPHLEAVLRLKGIPLKGIYTYRDASQILEASVRTIQQWCRDGKIRSRNLPGRGRFLSLDLEEFLAGSLRPFEGNDV